jgi:hypothetical protein
MSREYMPDGSSPDVTNEIKSWIRGNKPESINPTTSLTKAQLTEYMIASNYIFLSQQKKNGDPNSLVHAQEVITNVDNARRSEITNKAREESKSEYEVLLETTLQPATNQDEEMLRQLDLRFKSSYEMEAQRLGLLEDVDEIVDTYKQSWQSQDRAKWRLELLQVRNLDIESGLWRDPTKAHLKNSFGGLRNFYFQQKLTEVAQTLVNPNTAPETAPPPDSFAHWHKLYNQLNTKNNRTPDEEKQLKEALTNIEELWKEAMEQRILVDVYDQIERTYSDERSGRGIRPYMKKHAPTADMNLQQAFAEGDRIEAIYWNIFRDPKIQLVSMPNPERYAGLRKFVYEESLKRIKEKIVEEVGGQVVERDHGPWEWDVDSYNDSEKLYERTPMGYIQFKPELVHDQADLERAFRQYIRLNLRPGTTDVSRVLEDLPKLREAVVETATRLRLSDSEMNRLKSEAEARMIMFAAEWFAKIGKTENVCKLMVEFSKDAAERITALCKSYDGKTMEAGRILDMEGDEGLVDNGEAWITGMNGVHFYDYFRAEGVNGEYYNDKVAQDKYTSKIKRILVAKVALSKRRDSTNLNEIVSGLKNGTQETSDAEFVNSFGRVENSSDLEAIIKAAMEAYDKQDSGQTLSDNERNAIKLFQENTAEALDAVNTSMQMHVIFGFSSERNAPRLWEYDQHGNRRLGRSVEEEVLIRLGYDPKSGDCPNFNQYLAFDDKAREVLIDDTLPKPDILKRIKKQLDPRNNLKRFKSFNSQRDAIIRRQEAQRRKFIEMHRIVFAESMKYQEDYYKANPGELDLVDEFQLGENLGTPALNSKRSSTIDVDINGKSIKLEVPMVEYQPLQDYGSGSPLSFKKTMYVPYWLLNDPNFYAPKVEARSMAQWCDTQIRGAGTELGTRKFKDFMMGWSLAQGGNDLFFDNYELERFYDRFEEADKIRTRWVGGAIDRQEVASVFVSPIGGLEELSSDDFILRAGRNTTIDRRTDEMVIGVLRKVFSKQIDIAKAFTFLNDRSYVGKASKWAGDRVLNAWFDWIDSPEGIAAYPFDHYLIKDKLDKTKLSQIKNRTPREEILRRDSK